MVKRTNLKIAVLVLAILFANFLLTRNTIGFGNDLVISRSRSDGFNPFQVTAVVTYVLHLIGFGVGIYILLISISSQRDTTLA